MKKIIFIIFLAILGVLNTSCAQKEIPTTRPQVENPAFDNRLQDLLSFSVPLMGVEELQSSDNTSFIILDAREKEEYDISHIPNAEYLGYKNPDWSVLDNMNKDDQIILYCSVGYRSEKLGEELKKKGFQNVFNLYGSIFEWANQGFPLVDGKGNQVKTVHTYNKRWSRWVNEDTPVEKVW